MLPYYLLNADYGVVTTASREMQRLVVFGDFKTRVALIDQLLYFLKELMLEPPQEYLVV